MGKNLVEFDLFQRECQQILWYFWNLAEDKSILLCWRRTLQCSEWGLYCFKRMVVFSLFFYFFLFSFREYFALTSLLRPRAAKFRLMLGTKTLKQRGIFIRPNALWHGGLFLFPVLSEEMSQHKSTFTISKG